MFGKRMKNYLCLIIHVGTGKELAEYQLEARDDCTAKSKASDQFAHKDQKYTPRLREFGDDWYVDVVAL